MCSTPILKRGALRQEPTLEETRYRRIPFFWGAKSDSTAEGNPQVTLERHTRELDFKNMRFYWCLSAPTCGKFWFQATRSIPEPRETSARVTQTTRRDSRERAPRIHRAGSPFGASLIVARFPPGT